jgi:hypothetical protein
MLEAADVVVVSQVVSVYRSGAGWIAGSDPGVTVPIDEV